MHTLRSHTTDMQAAPLSPDEENDAEVRREDQNNINHFARLNARLHEIRQETADLKVRGK